MLFLEKLLKEKQVLKSQILEKQRYCLELQISIVELEKSQWQQEFLQFKFCVLFDDVLFLYLCGKGFLGCELEFDVSWLYLELDCVKFLLFYLSSMSLEFFMNGQVVGYEFCSVLSWFLFKQNIFQYLVLFFDQEVVFCIFSYGGWLCLEKLFGLVVFDYIRLFLVKIVLRWYLSQDYMVFGRLVVSELYLRVEYIKENGFFYQSFSVFGSMKLSFQDLWFLLFGVLQFVGEKSSEKGLRECVYGSSGEFIISLFISILFSIVQFNKFLVSIFLVSVVLFSCVERVRSIFSFVLQFCDFLFIFEKQIGVNVYGVGSRSFVLVFVGFFYVGLVVISGVLVGSLVFFIFGVELVILDEFFSFGSFFVIVGFCSFILQYFLLLVQFWNLFLVFFVYQFFFSFWFGGVVQGLIFEVSKGDLFLDFGFLDFESEVKRRIVFIIVIGVGSVKQLFFSKYSFLIVSVCGDCVLSYGQDSCKCGWWK